jgi:PAS domain S-box-containing protein
MKAAPLPVDEVERIAELVRYQILDTEEEKDYNDVVRLAADICNCPISSITFLDTGRQWFKASINMPYRETSRDISFCSHAILQDDVMIVPDALKDSRFSDYPDVTGGISIRFYAGAPIVSQRGKKLGTLCVIDTKKRTLDKSQEDALHTMASMVSRLLELRVNARRLVDSSDKLLKSAITYKELFDYSNVAQWIYDLDSDSFVAINSAAAKLYGYNEEEFRKLKLKDIINPDQPTVKKFLKDISAHKSLTQVTGHKSKEDGKIMVEATLSPVAHKGTNIVVATIVDLSEKLQLQQDLIEGKKQSVKEVETAAMTAQLKERNFLGRELHDNISQMLSSTNMYLDIAFADDDMRLDLIQKSQANLIATIHQVRSLSRRLVNTSAANPDLSKGIREMMKPYELSKQFEFHYSARGELATLPVDIKTMMLRIVQEATHNIVKYAGAANVWVTIKYGKKLKLNIADDGRGFDKNNITEGIGLKNMRERVEALKGSFDILSEPGSGTAISIVVDGPF